MKDYFCTCLMLLSIACWAQQTQKTEVRKITDMTSANSIRAHKIDSALYNLSFIDNLKNDSTYTIKITYISRFSIIRHSFYITRIEDKYTVLCIRTQLKGEGNNYAYPKTRLSPTQINSLRQFENDLTILLSENDPCIDVGATEFDLTVSGKTKSFIDSSCTFENEALELEYLLFRTRHYYQ